MKSNVESGATPALAADLVKTSVQDAPGAVTEHPAVAESVLGDMLTAMTKMLVFRVAMSCFTPATSEISPLSFVTPPPTL